jgi:DNA-binding NarL/FixJ family response regulator
VRRRGFLLGLVAGLLASAIGARSGGLARGTYRRHLLTQLSPREREVFALRANGWSKAQIGRDLHLSVHTVGVHIQNILVKLGVHSELEAIALVRHTL